MYLIRAMAAEHFFREMRNVAASYINTLDTIQPNDSTTELGHYRDLIDEMTPRAQELARELHVETSITVRPAPATGRGAVGVDAFVALTDLQGLSPMLQIPPSMIWSVMNRCVGAAHEAKRRALIRLVIPVYWLIDIPAAILSWPFAVLRAAGFDKNIEDHLIVRIIKVAELIAMAVFLGYVGVRTEVIDAALQALGAK
jgi:hypothetical protein